MQRFLQAAGEAIARCRLLAHESEEPGFTTRTFLSAPMRAVHARLSAWMQSAGMSVHVDSAGNLRGLYPGAMENAPRLLIGSHLDTVPRAGAFDGVLGVVLGVALVELLGGRRMNFPIELIGFSEEEGVRFGTPFIGSRAFIGDVPDELLAIRDAAGTSVSDALRAFGLDPSKICEARFTDDAIGYFEFHIEQGPVLDSLGLPLGIVEAIAGQSRLSVVFEGKANHAGTTPMNLRRDALTAAAEWIGAVEADARGTPGLVASVGRLEVSPGAENVIAGGARASLDVRHGCDATRHSAVARMLESAQGIGMGRGVAVRSECRLDQAAAAMDHALTYALQRAAEGAGYLAQRMTSGAGHDAMILAREIPSAMLFLRSPGGISHHPDETVVSEDVAAALATGIKFLEHLKCPAS